MVTIRSSSERTHFNLWQTVVESRRGLQPETLSNSVHYQVLRLSGTIHSPDLLFGDPTVVVTASLCG